MGSSSSAAAKGDLHASESRMSSLDDASDGMEESESSVSRSLDVQGIASSSSSPSRSEEYRQLFHLPLDEVLIQDFNCAIQESILIQGHMYLFVRHVCFYSNIFGFETKKVLPFHEVTCVQKAKTAAIFHNAIEIFVGPQKYFFASFLSRDEAFRLIIDRWSQLNSAAMSFLDPQDDRPDSLSIDDATLPSDVIKDSNWAADELVSDRSSDDNQTEECSSSSGVENIASAAGRNSEMRQNLGQDELTGARDKSDQVDITSVSFKGQKMWKSLKIGAPVVPQFFTLVAESQIPISVEDFFGLYFSNNAFRFLEDFHNKCGDIDFQCTLWEANDQLEHSRELSFRHPVKFGLGARYGHCRELQKFCIYKNSHLVVKASQQITEVPYGDYFHVEGLWDVQQEDVEGSCCILRVYVNVAFTKKTIWRGKIEQSTLEECRAACEVWIAEARGHLDHHMSEGRESVDTEGHSNIETRIEKSIISPEHCKEFVSPSDEKEDTLLKQGLHQGSSDRSTEIMHNWIIKWSCDAYSLLTFSVNKCWVKILSCLRMPTSSAMVLVIVLFLFLLLLQGIVIYLLLQTPKFELGHEETVVSRTGGGTNMAWLERHIEKVKYELLIIEAQLDKLQYECKFLKSRLRFLEQLKL